MVYAQLRILSAKWDVLTCFGFWDTNGSSNLDQKTRARDRQKIEIKRKNLLNCGLCLSGWSQGKTERKRKEEKFLDLAREIFKKLWKMKVMVRPIIIVAFGTVTKRLIKRVEDLEIRQREEIIQTATLLRSARILRRVPETWRDLLSHKL